MAEVVSNLLLWISAALLAVGLTVSQLLLGGWWYPVLAAPSLLLVACAAIAAAFASTRSTTLDAPGAWCIGSTLAFGVYMLWRQATSPDYYAARDDTWLLGGAMAVYFTAAWHLRSCRAAWLVLGALFALLLGQVFLLVAQFTAQSPFHPWPHLARWFALPEGGVAVANPGFVTGTFASRGTLSAVLQSTTFLALGMLVWGRAGVAIKLLLLWITAAGFVGLMLCLSRAAYTGLLAGMVAFGLASFFILQRGVVVHRGWLALGALSLIAISAALAFAVGMESFAVRLRLEAMGTDVFREQLLFRVLPPMLQLDPWMGAGSNMFDQLSERYRDHGMDARPVHAHNDWLQLLVEYGRIGLGLGVLFFAVHIAAGWRNLMFVAHRAPPTGLMPQGMELGLLSGSLAALMAQAAHSFFDYRMHVAAPVLIIALCAGWLAGNRSDAWGGHAAPQTWWLRLVGVLLPLISGVLLMWEVARAARPEYEALAAENAMSAGRLDESWRHVERGLDGAPLHPRLLVIAGQCAGRIGYEAGDLRERSKWLARSAEFWLKAVRERPYFAYAWREAALVLDSCRRSDQAQRLHLRAIGRDPNHAAGYEYLALNFWNLGQHEEAIRLMRIAQKLPGSRLSHKFLPRIEEDLQRKR